MTTKLDPEARLTGEPEARQNVIGTVPGVARAVQGLADAPPISPKRRKPKSRGPWRRIIALILLAAIGAGVYGYWKPLSEKFAALIGSKGDSALANIQTYVAHREDLRITMIEQGKLAAVKNATVEMGADGKITWLAESGTRVKKGDLLVSIDKKQYEDERLRLNGELDAAKAALAIAEQAVPIAKSSGEAGAAAARTKREEAALALKTYTTIEAPKKISEMETQINDARTKLSEGQKKRIDLQGQLDEKALDDDDEKKSLEQQMALQVQTVASLQRVQATLEEQRKLFRAYTYQQDLKAKQQALDNSTLDSSKAEVAAKSELMQKDAEVRKNQILIDRLNLEIKNLDEKVAKCNAYAPVDGLIFYGSPEMMRYGYSYDEIRVGAEWYSQQGAIMTIPDLSAFQVEVPIAEAYRGRLQVGTPATATIEAVPGLALEGKITSLANVARQRVSWDSTSPQVFDVTIVLTGADPRMVTGMTTKVEIVAALLKAVIAVPVEAVFNEDGRTAAFVWVAESGGSAGAGHAEKRPVLTGQSNDHVVEIKQGLAEGDTVLLSRPATFITPADYKEQVAAMFPATAIAPPPPAAMTAPTTRPDRPDPAPQATTMPGAALENMAPSTEPGTK